MFKIEERADLIRFEHNDVEYAMTRAEIEAAHAYVEHENRVVDARRQLNFFVFGYDDPAFGDAPEDADSGEAEDMADFEGKYGITYAEATKMTGQFAKRFEQDLDCNTDENSAWENAIRSVLEEAASGR